MRQNDIQIGGQYRVRIGSRLAPVTVLYRRPGSGRGRFVCRTHDTDREIVATAARLRPMPGTADAAAENRRRCAAVARRAPRPFSGNPGERVADAGPVPGVIERVSCSPVLALSLPNVATVHRAADACHVAESFGHVARRVRRRLGAVVIWRTIPRALRRGILHEAAARHGANRGLYRQVMGHDPLPSARMVAEAVGVACGLGPMPR